MIRQAKAVLVTFVFVGLVLIGAGAIAYLRTTAFVSAAIRTSAVVTDLEYRSSSRGSGGYVAVLSFVDELGQTQTTRTKSAQNPAPADIGQTVKLVYLPDDPESARIDSFKGLWIGPILLLAGGCAMFVMGLVGLISIRRMSRDEDAG